MLVSIDSKITPKTAAIIRDAYTKCDALWPITHNVSFFTCTGQSRNGYCRRLNARDYNIYINKNLINDHDILEVVTHELLHSYPLVFFDGHRGQWEERASIVKNKYNIDIQRTNSFELAATKQTKIRLECTNCHKHWDYYRAPKFINRLSEAMCPYCKTHTIVRNNEYNKEV